MTLRVAINGYGRIGRNVLRAHYESGAGRAIRFVAINDLGPREALAHLTRHDSTHGPFPGLVSLDGDALVVNGDRIPLLCAPDPGTLPWADLGVDLVLECTGRFRSRALASRHLLAGAGRVVIGAAPFDDVDATLVYGVNHRTVRPEHRVISSVSCTTNALVPLVKILDDAFGIESGTMTEIHPVTSDQALVDGPHRDLRRARAACASIVPTTSSSIGALRRVLPGVGDRIVGLSLRVPTANVAALDLGFVSIGEPTAGAINDLFASMAGGEYEGLLGYCDEPLVSRDFNHSRFSLIFDAAWTRVTGRQAKVLVWYDNEWGYATRLLDLCAHLGTAPWIAGGPGPGPYQTSGNAMLV